MSSTTLTQTLPAAFEWTTDKILVLLLGYLRIDINMGDDDISSIVLKYLKNLFIDYHIHNKLCTNYHI